MAKCLLVFLAFVYFVSNAEYLSLRNSFSLKNFKNLTRMVYTKNGKINCSEFGSLFKGIMSWFFRNEKKYEKLLPVPFYLYTRKQSGVQLEKDKIYKLNLTDFNIKRKTVFIVHGFFTHGGTPWIHKMKKAYLEYEDVNIIVVDWGKYSITWNYYKAAIKAISVGQQLAQFINNVNNMYSQYGNESFGEIHMIGHSLGSHVCGIATENIKKVGKAWKVARITGLDPAQPCFVDTGLSLNKNDASFVDIIHTNGKMFNNVGLGIVDQAGDVDFYINGGYYQPGCSRFSTRTLIKMTKFVNAVDEAICSHQRACEYFTESLIIAARKTKTKFWGFRWNGKYDSAASFVGKNCTTDVCCEMGINADKYSHRGKIFVATAIKTPYCGPLTSTDINAILKQLKRDNNMN